MYQTLETSLEINVNGKLQQFNPGRNQSVNSVNPDLSRVYGSLLQVKNQGPAEVLAEGGGTTEWVVEDSYKPQVRKVGACYRNGDCYCH